jgi:hypothetical protein
MCRQSVLCWGLTCVLSVSGFAGITQDQGFGIGGETIAQMLDGIGSAEEGSVVKVSIGQASLPACGLWAMQDDKVVFSQKGLAAGVCGGLGVLQNGIATGAQSQQVDGCLGPVLQGQGLDLTLAQKLGESCGLGVASGTQNLLADRTQASGNVLGLLTSNQFVKACQDASVDGGPGSGGVIMAGLSCTVTQGQSID